MNFTFQDGNPVGTGMSILPKQLIMRPVRKIVQEIVRAVVASPKQANLIMQLTGIFLLALGLQVSAATYSQTVSFTGKDVPLKTVFASVKKQTGYGVFFENGEAMLQSSAPITIDLKNVPLDVFLKVCLKDQPLEYTMEGKTIFIKKKEPVVASLDPVSAGPIIQIKGRVTNDKGEPLVNANVTVKRTGHGTVTDANGNFFLRNVNSDDVVMVSFIGYKSLSMPIKDRIALTIVMSATTNDLDKVVVQAYGTTTQRFTTGNIGTVTSEDIAKQPVMNVLEAVQGQIPGVVVTNTSGYASAPIKVEIRGRNTIGDFPADPLYIIDGVPLTILPISGRDTYENGSQGAVQSGVTSPAGGQSPFFNINPGDIESITVLKDADATAIYGSRGANGVILITTKKGRAGKSKFNLNVYNGASNVPRHYQMLNTSQYVSMRTEALVNDGTPPNINNATDLVVWDTTRYTDWQKKLWGHTGDVTDIEGSLSGGNQQTTYRLAGNFHSQREIQTYTGSNLRGGGMFNINYKSDDHKFSLGLTVHYTATTADLIFLNAAITLPPNAPAIFDSKGNLNYNGWSPLDGYFPFGNLLSPYKSKTNFLNSNLVMNYELFKGLALRTSLGYNNSHNSQYSATTIASQDPLYNPTGSNAIGTTDFNNFIIEPNIEYNLIFGHGKLDALVGGSFQSNETNSNVLLGYGFTNDALISSVTPAPIKGANDFEGQYKYEAAFGRLTYNWLDRYIININMRRDGSSRFGPGRKFGNFGSVGGAWIFSESKLIKQNLHFLSFGKIRVSYGTTGGDQVSDYQYLSRWNFGQFPYNNTQPVFPIGHTDSTIHWQVNKKLEAAINLGLFQDHVIVEAVWYRNRCNDQLVSLPTPAFSGFTGVTTNSPADVQNTGYEFSLSAKIITTTKFNWSAKVNVGINRNKLVSYPNFSNSPYVSTLSVGKPLDIIYLFHYTGVDPQTGLYTFEDKNKDGQITFNYQNPGNLDDRYIYDKTTKYDGGFTTNFGYNEWALSLFFYFRNQNGINALANLPTPGGISNEPSEIINHWRQPGNHSKFAKFTANPNDQSYLNFSDYSDGIYGTASYVRLQNVSLSYTLKSKRAENRGGSTYRFYVQGDNIFVLTRYQGLDPEIQNLNGLPIPRTITVGMSCNF